MAGLLGCTSGRACRAASTRCLRVPAGTRVRTCGAVEVVGIRGRLTQVMSASPHTSGAPERVAAPAYLPSANAWAGSVHMAYTLAVFSGMVGTNVVTPNLVRLGTSLTRRGHRRQFSLRGSNRRVTTGLAAPAANPEHSRSCVPGLHESSLQCAPDQFSVGVSAGAARGIRTSDPIITKKRFFRCKSAHKSARRLQSLVFIDRTSLQREHEDALGSESDLPKVFPVSRAGGIP
jgi:hypothetical protein